MAAIEIEDEDFRQRILSLPVTFGKMVLTVVGLAGGASIGREGPTIHVGGGIMYWIGRRFGYTDPKALSRFVLAGGGAGIAAAFNAPLAGVVFAIEELAGTYEDRFSGIILTAVIFAGVVSLGVLGDYAYFGRVGAQLALRPGVAGGALVRHLRGHRRRLVRAHDRVVRPRRARAHRGVAEADADTLRGGLRARARGARSA